MAITAAQVSVGTTAVPLAYVPAGPCTVVISVAAASTVTVYIGTSPSVTASGAGAGFPIAGGAPPVTIPACATSGGTQLYAIASAASTPVGVLISTDR